ncbi:MAG: hypothetical protein M3Q07_01450 [Pseudobdellovibrionaceae bacterium]|nr:hypothetical protein [Pseudobdellovibrionaceae bacterium]
MGSTHQEELSEKLIRVRNNECGHLFVAVKNKPVLTDFVAEGLRALAIRIATAKDFIASGRCNFFNYNLTFCYIFGGGSQFKEKLVIASFEWDQNAIGGGKLGNGQFIKFGWRKIIDKVFGLARTNEKFEERGKVISCCENAFIGGCRQVGRAFQIKGIRIIFADARGCTATFPVCKNRELNCFFFDSEFSSGSIRFSCDRSFEAIEVREGPVQTLLGEACQIFFDTVTPLLGRIVPKTFFGNAIQ